LLCNSPEVINFNPKNPVAPERGKILISEPFLNDPYFKRTVVIICEHNDDEGTFGFILNKYLDLNLEDLIQDFPDFETKISMGGPVEQNSLYFLHTRPDLLKDSKPITDNLCIGSSFSELKHFAGLGMIGPSDVRFFVGYSGWTKGQLAQELKDRSWIVASTAVENIMNTQDDNLWQNALKDLGREFAILANFPEDPSLN
jgi:putative transcriptional regulator